MMLIPAGAVDRPGSQRELVGEPVVCGRVEQLVARNDRVELALHRRQVTGVALCGIEPEADHQLRLATEQRLGGEIPERMTRTDRILQARRAPRPAEELYSPR